MVNIARGLSDGPDWKSFIGAELCSFLGAFNVMEGNGFVYGVLRAGRGDGTEALVLMAPSKTRSGLDNICGISLLIAVARRYIKYQWWARDLILLVTGLDGYSPERTLRSFLLWYHSTSLSGERLDAGVIQAALSLELNEEKGAKCSSFGNAELFVEGSSGLLPNLDLINALVMIQRHRGEALNIGPGIPILKITEKLGVVSKMLHGAFMLLRQAFGSFSHGPFLDYRIDAVTISLSAIELQGNSNEATRHDKLLFDLVQLSLRSLNNILEHLHQSFFFYILIDNEHYVSIANYVVMGLLPIVSLMLRFILDIKRALSLKRGAYCLCLDALWMSLFFVTLFLWNMLVADFAIPRSRWWALLMNVPSFLIRRILALPTKSVRPFCCFTASLVLSTLLISNFGLSCVSGITLGILLQVNLPLLMQNFLLLALPLLAVLLTEFFEGGLIHNQLERLFNPSVSVILALLAIKLSSRPETMIFGSKG